MRALASSAPRSGASMPPTLPRSTTRAQCWSIRRSIRTSGCARISGRKATCIPASRTSLRKRTCANGRAYMCRALRRVATFCWSRPATRCSTIAARWRATQAPSRSWSKAATTACRAFRATCPASSSSAVQLLYEEDGDLKVGAVLAQAPASFQVESPHGRRSKVKAASVLLSFERPSGAELLAAAQQFAAQLDAAFLWECSGAREFGFQDLAREYVGHEPGPVEAAGVLLKLHAAPMYFYRRGKGRFQPAPEETLKLALAGLEKKKRVQESIAAWAARLARFDCPPEIAALKHELLYAPDRNKSETKAFEQACKEAGLSPARLLERCGVLTDAHEYHLQGFLQEFFPRGEQFAAHELPPLPADLPLAKTAAFSLDDVGTTEIDDAFSVERVRPGELRIGVHIAAPALGFGPGSPL